MRPKSCASSTGRADAVSAIFPATAECEEPTTTTIADLSTCESATTSRIWSCSTVFSSILVSLRTTSSSIWTA
ncbi:hypothetical protein SNOG_13844 [Parastagonospora nodorum SN15]|uniref:Uncharacterized protein n=1 Tax=Phaeosphaeria nodorum (strain SN15 / ATCC MYA-4574 / FGSC 10173) TaxID=321614 RepID=Q0U320_PHANO|nr:hypothetical protein SNOG_13844 [Parastagonospora nodorum SN15]EAT78868.2 hypothetical protein SNOG_13844 [Parastagonospora nodorum SN15]